MNILEGIEKPARYVGGELNSICKDDARLRFALCFPDIYEIGMSNLAIQILYAVLNDRPDTSCERAFTPWTDMAQRLREQDTLLASLETGRPLRDFDMVGFSLSYEMSYSNVLAMLELGGIPLLARDRAEDSPIVIGGGQCTVNPEPAADFFDLFVIGEGEEVLGELCDLWIDSQEKGEGRQAFLRRAASIEGIYVPSLYTPVYNDDGTILRIEVETCAPERVRRRIIQDFETVRAVRRPVVPSMEVVHDRCVLEIMRGCSNGCRFCQAGYATRPVRERSMEESLRIAEDIISSTGYEEIALCSLSSGDYSQILPLMRNLIDTYQDQHVSVSMPSLRMDSFEFAEQVQEVRKKGLTFAPEAGTQRLRDVINKNITEEDVLRAARSAFESGATHVKLYFMIGLPTETYEDLDGIADLVGKIRSQFYEVPKEKRKGRLEIAVSASNFVPKPVTPFQWEAQDTVESLDAKQRYLKEKLRMRGVRFSYHDTQTSFLEAVLARGDRRLGSVLLEAYRQGAMLDAWREQFKPDAYKAAFEKTGIDPAFYANRQRSTDETLPYAHIDALIDEKYLLRELGKAREATTTRACSQVCAGCGLQDGACTLHAKKSAS